MPARDACGSGAADPLHESLSAELRASAQRGPTLPAVAEPENEFVPFSQDSSLFLVELLEVAGECAEAVECGSRAAPLPRQAAVESCAFLRLASLSLCLLERLGFAGAGGVTLQLLPSSNHVTRLSRDPSLLKGSERVTE
ncbi:hypothetical protein [Microbacterium aureliae]